MSTEIRIPDMTKEQSVMPILAAAERKDGFDEVALGYTQDQAKKEAYRCMDCPAKYCKNSCPLHNDIPQMMEFVRQGDYEAAYRCIRQTSPIPEICSRVCAQEKQCQKNCTRAIRSEAVGIGAVERFVCDWAAENGITDLKTEHSSDKSVAVVGAGPAGIACALTLAKEGCGVTVYEKTSYIGGVPYEGIPSFVLPKEWSQKIRERMEQEGITVCMEHPVENVKKLLSDGFDAVFVGTGAGEAVALDISGSDLDGVWSAGDYLRAVNTKKAEEVSKADRVLVIGGGDTAVDAARCAVRLGAKEVSILYRRTIDDMPANQKERQQAKEEGVCIETLLNPVAIEKQDGALKVICAKMKAGEEEYPGGRRRVQKDGDKTVSYAADLVIYALGYQADAPQGVLTTQDGCIAVEHDQVTSRTDGIYAGGDVVTGAASVAQAAALGVKAAYAILGGQ